MSDEIDSNSGWITFLWVMAGIVIYFLVAHCIFTRFFVCCKRKSKLRLPETFVSDKFESTGNKWRLLASHRGGSMEGPENTNIAFQNSINLGLNMLECDIQFTKDQKVIVMHDSNLGRVCGEQYEGRKVSEFNFDELPKMQKQVPVHFMPDCHYRLTDHEDGSFVTLREMFEVCEGKFISIDMKSASPEMTHIVNDLVKEFNREHLTVWGSMFSAQHALIQQLNPNVSCFFTGGQVVKVYLMYLLGLLWLYPLPADCFFTAQFTSKQLSRFRRLMRDSNRNTCCARFLLQLVRGVHLVSNGLFRHLKKRGICTMMWVLNSEEEFLEVHNLYGDNLDGVMTDVPSELTNFAQNVGRIVQQ